MCCQLLWRATDLEHGVVPHSIGMLPHLWRFVPPYQKKKPPHSFSYVPVAKRDVVPLYGIHDSGAEIFASFLVLRISENYFCYYFCYYYAKRWAERGGALWSRESEDLVKRSGLSLSLMLLLAEVKHIVVLLWTFLQKVLYLSTQILLQSHYNTKTKIHSP